MNRCGDAEGVHGPAPISRGVVVVLAQKKEYFALVNTAQCTESVNAKTFGTEEVNKEERKNMCEVGENLVYFDDIHDLFDTVGNRLCLENPLNRYSYMCEKYLQT